MDETNLEIMPNRTLPQVSPQVSIVTPSYNQGDFVERTILSVICQDYPNLQYVFVDAISVDKTPEILEKYRPHFAKLIIEPDKGQTEALNKGFRHCTGEILAYLNSDDCYADKDVIATIVQQFQAHPEIDVIYGQRNCINKMGRFGYCPPFRAFCEQSLYRLYSARVCVLAARYF
jgi:glycosyltransferase involved in cell wall biosynthesis